MSTTAPAPTPTRSTWLDYRAVWRWHFYAGLFCIPFVLWLASTGSIYLFRPQIERLLDHPYDHLAHLSLTGPRASADAEVRAALDAVPGSVLHSYQLPRLPNAAPQILVGRGAEEYRVYVHPQTLRILKIQNEDKRPMMVVFHLHGELFMGDRGSYIVELAASWTIVMILTGLYLWWPRHIHGLAGILYPRLRQGRRILFRDLHAVTGVYVSAFALTLLLTGLPWAKSWGHYLKFLRSAAAGHTVQQDWTTGRSSEIAARLAENHNAMAGMDDMPGMDMGTSQQNPVILSERSESKDPLLSLQQITQRAAALNLVAPVLIDPPKTQGAPWTVRSDTQNRPLRETVTLDPHTGAILSRKGFAQKNLVDRIVAVGTALHEGQLFGLLNQLVELATALGLITLALSAVVLWWRRRATGVLGAPQPNPPRGFSFTLAALVIALGLYLPMMGASLILVLLTERLILRRIPRARHWLGLQPA